MTVTVLSLMPTLLQTEHGGAYIGCCLMSYSIIPTIRELKCCSLRDTDMSVHYKSSLPTMAAPYVFPLQYLTHAFTVYYCIRHQTIKASYICFVH